MQDRPPHYNRNPIRKMAWLFLALAAVIAVLATAMPQRERVFLSRAKGKIAVAHGCTVFSPGIFEDENRFFETINKVSEVQRDGPIAMYDTPIGSVWYPLGAWTLPALVELTEADIYRWRSMVKPGDVVLDVGANVGSETRSALDAGAGLVVAIEPDPHVLECLRRNLVSEIREKRVIVVPKGAWDKEETLALHLDPGNAGGATFLPVKADQSVQVPLTTIDRLVAELHLPKVSLIKMHAEGADKRALWGAAETIRRYHPRLALALEYNLSDVDVLPAVARQIWSGYRVKLTPCTKTFNRIHPRSALLTP